MKLDCVQSQFRPRLSARRHGLPQPPQVILLPRLLSGQSARGLGHGEFLEKMPSFFPEMYVPDVLQSLNLDSG